MTRERQWRRFQTERKFLRVLKRIRQRETYWQSIIGDVFDDMYRNFKYSRRLSQTEIIFLPVKTKEQLELYQIWQARTKRDNQKNCRCSMCRQGWRETNEWRNLSLQERRFYTHKNKHKKIDLE